MLEFRNKKPPYMGGPKFTLSSLTILTFATLLD